MRAGAFPNLFELNLAVAGSASPGTQLILSADVATGDHEENLKNNSGSLTIFVQPAAADLNVQSDLNSVPLTIGRPVEFNVEVSNLGTIAASSSALTITLPNGISIKTGDPAPGTTSGNTVTWQLGAIEPGASRIVVVTIALAANLTPGEFELTPDPASLLHFEFDASTASTQVNPANSHIEMEKHVERAGSDLKVWLSVQGAENPGELPVGKDVTYTITYGNFGNAPAQQTAVSLSLSEGLNLSHAAPPATGTSKNDRFAGGVLSWNIGDVAVGQSNIIKSQIHVASVPEDGSLVMATISAPGPSANSGENVAYSLRHASRAAGSHGMVTQGGHLLRWLFLPVVVIVLWAVLRARRRRTGT